MYIIMCMTQCSAQSAHPQYALHMPSRLDQGSEGIQLISRLVNVFLIEQVATIIVISI